MKKQLIEEPIQIDCSLEAVEDVFNLHGNEQRVVFNCVNCDQPVIKKIAGIRIQKQFLCTKCGKILNAKTTFQKKIWCRQSNVFREFKRKVTRAL